MKTIKFLLLLTLFACLLFFSRALFKETNQPLPETPKSRPTLKASVTDLGNGEWKVSYQFEKPQSALIFSRSVGNYRVGDWISLTKGVRIKRVAGFDAILLDKPKTNFSFKFKASSKQLNGDYTPFIQFSDGGVALFTGQFELLPVKNQQAIENLNGKLQNYLGQQYNCEVTVKTDKQLIFKGQVFSESIIDRFFGGGEYVYVGGGEITQGKSFIGVLDSDLPTWIRDRLDSDLEAIFSGLDLLFEQNLPYTPTVLFAFHGFKKIGVSNSGGAIGNNLLALESEGSMYKQQNDRAHSYLLWFFAHEAAHLYQHKKSYYLHQLPDRWIYEGGANAIANYLLEDQRLANPQTLNKRKADAFNSCATFLKSGKPLAYAVYSPSRAHYYCGEIFSYITDAALPNHSYFEFWNALVSQVVDEQKQTPTGTELYFKTMTELGADQEVINSLNQLVAGKAKSPEKQLLKMMSDVGMVFTTNKQGKLVTLLLP